METKYRDQDAQGAMGQNYRNQESRQGEKETINPQNSDANQRLSEEPSSQETLRSGLYGRNGDSNPGPRSTKKGNGEDDDDDDDDDDDFSNEELDTDGADTDTETWIDDDEEDD